MNKPSLELLTPNNCVLALIDHEPQMFFGVHSTDRQTIINNVVGLLPKQLKSLKYQQFLPRWQRKSLVVL